MLDWREDAIFRGYWQSEKYFASIRDVLCSELTLLESLDANNADLLRQIQNSMSVGLNVRRGDYLKLQHLHPLCTAAYFNRAIAYIEQHVQQPHFFVYSDDLPWCREHLCLHSEATWLEVPSHERWYPVMEVVRHCRHHIISNSTFSWWAAWLCDFQDKIVIAPTPWFNAGDEHKLGISVRRNGCSCPVNEHVRRI